MILETQNITYTADSPLYLTLSLKANGLILTHFFKTEVSLQTNFDFFSEIL